MERTNVEPVAITLSRDEALVLFEWLQRNEVTDFAGTIEDQVELRALWDLDATLESLLPEPLDPRYKEFVPEARNRLRDSEG